MIWGLGQDERFYRERSIPEVVSLHEPHNSEDLKVT